MSRQNSSTKPGLPSTAADVAPTAASSSGYMTGMNSTARMKSRPRVLTEMVASSVPTPAMPIEPTSSASGIIHQAPPSGRPDRNITKNSGIVIACTISRKIRLPTALAKKMTGRSTGESSSASRHPWSFSCTSERLSPSIEVKTNASHSRPAAMRRTSKPEPDCDSAIW